VVNIQRCSERAAGISRGRLDPDIVKRSFPKQTSISDAIQCDASGKAKISLVREPMRVPGHAQQGFLGDNLDGPCQIHLAFGDS
jgi:hypothetical protein